MTGARMSTLATLRGTIGRLEAAGLRHDAERVALGHGAADAMLQGGLARGVLHEVFAPESRHAASATGFVAGLAWRSAMRRPLMWVRQDFAARECGAPSMNGFAELGFDPRRIVTVHAADVDMALRVTADALACDALGAVVLDVWGDTRQIDLVASRKLTLAAQASGVTCLALRTSALPAASTAETRWVVRAARSPPGPAWSGWGAPVVDARLIRNRHGQTGQWIMEWNCHECLFREPAAHPQPAAAAPADRPIETPVVVQWHGSNGARPRRAG
jgi:protein ImuA